VHADWPAQFLPCCAWRYSDRLGSPFPGTSRTRRSRTGPSATRVRSRPPMKTGTTNAIQIDSSARTCGRRGRCLWTRAIRAHSTRHVICRHSRCDRHSRQNRSARLLSGWASIPRFASTSTFDALTDGGRSFRDGAPEMPARPTAIAAAAPVSLTRALLLQIPHRRTSHGRRPPVITSSTN